MQESERVLILHEVFENDASEQIQLFPVIVVDYDAVADGMKIAELLYKKLNRLLILQQCLGRYLGESLPVHRLRVVLVDG